MTETNNQSNRPDWYEGILTYDGDEYRFFSGDETHTLSSMPYGTYGPLYKPTHHDVKNSSHHSDAIQWAEANEIWDPKYQKKLDSEYGYGMSKHKMGAPKFTNGCLSIHRHDWPKLTKKIWEAIDRGEKLYIHVTPDGIVINKVRNKG
jgi:hypothetical protein